MQVSFYAHAWQAFLMMLAGVVSVFASMMGYLWSGGGEQLLQQSLVFLDTKGQARFDNLKTDLANSKISVFGLRRGDIREGTDNVSGMMCEEFEVRLDLWPWPPRVDSVHVHGVPNLKIAVESGFLQQRGRRDLKGPPFPIYFDHVDLSTQIGDGPLLNLKGCSGVFLKRSGTSRDLIGELSLSELNGQPFPFTLTSHADGRWECRGEQLRIDTKAIQKEVSTLGNDPLDPVELILRALVTGEFGAKGTVSLHVAIQPASESKGRPFKCEGSISYQDLTLQFPPQSQPQTKDVPNFLGWMMGSPDSMWPHWLLPEAIRTGPKGRLFFHMDNKRLEFHCDKDSVFVPRIAGKDTAALTGFRGVVDTGEGHRPVRIFLAGELGNRLDCEMTMARNKNGGRIFDLMFQPGSAALQADPKVSLWHFRSRIEDLSEQEGRKSDQPLLKFAVEMDSRNCPDTLLLPPGAVDFSGHFRTKGQYWPNRVLTLDEICWEKGGLIFGGKQKVDKKIRERQMYGPIFDGLRQLWGAGEKEWRLQDVSLKGKAKVQFDRQANWMNAEFLDWKLSSGQVAYRGLSTDLGAVGIQVAGSMTNNIAQTAKPGTPAIRIKAKVMEGTVESWSMVFTAQKDGDGYKELRFEENGVPLNLHPERDTLKDTPYVKTTMLVFNKRVDRITVLKKLQKKEGKKEYIRETLGKK